MDDSIGVEEPRWPYVSFFVVIGVAVGGGGVFLEIVLGKAAVHWVSKLF